MIHAEYHKWALTDFGRLAIRAAKFEPEADWRFGQLVKIQKVGIWNVEKNEGPLRGQ
jgi:hypothetical protein